MKGTKLASAAPELGTSTHLTTELFRPPKLTCGRAPSKR